MADLDLVAEEAECCGLRKQSSEMFVAQMKLKTTGVSAHSWIFAAQQLIERQSQFFGRKIPTCLVDGLFKGQRHPFNVATARPPDSVNKASGYLAFKARPSLFAKDAFNFAERGKWMKQAR